MSVLHMFFIYLFNTFSESFRGLKQHTRCRNSPIHITSKMHRHINERYKIQQEKAKRYCNKNETKITKQNEKVLVVSASEVTYATLMK
jgi:hypothetical protein